MDIHASYLRILNNDPSIPMPIAAILALTELIDTSDADTMFELVRALNDAALLLKSSVKNPISLSAGCDLFVEFVTVFPHESDNFINLKRELVRQGQLYATHATKSRAKIAKLTLDFIQDDSILTHSYSRVVEHALIHAHKQCNKRFSVYVTEARPFALGSKTYNNLTNAGIPCTLILDAAVAYAMPKVHIVLVGSEAVVESGGLINALGSYQIALVAKAANVPFYALAESYKFHRMFPLSQYDLPTHTDNILSFSPPDSTNHILPEEQSKRNPEVDYTSPDLISLVFSDVGILTPEGVSQYLVGMFAG